MDYVQEAVNKIHPNLQELNHAVLQYAQNPDNRRTILGYAAAGALTYYFASTVYRVFVPPKRLRQIPRPSQYDWMKSLIEKTSPSDRARKLLIPLIEEHGLCLKYQHGEWMILIADYDKLKPFLKDTTTFPKKMLVFNSDFSLAKDPNILGANKEDWKRQRKVANPAFHRRMPVETFGRVTKTVFSVLDSQTAPYPDVASVTRRWALDCIGLGGFSFDMGSVSNPMSKYSVIYNDAFAILRDPIQFLFPSFGKLPAQWFAYRRKAVKASDQLRQLLTEIIEKRKKEVLQLRQQGEDVDSHSKDLLTMLIEANLNDDDEKVYMTDSELISNLSIFYAAGHETTANAVSSMLYYLATHPDIQTKLRDEVISIMGDVPEDVIPTDEQLRKMTFLECCIKETMRINPPTSGNQLRFAAKDTTLGDFFIPEGTSMQMDLWILHHMDKYWKDPDTFNPYRFDSKSADYVDTTWMPFGSGERICIGMNFSLAEQRVMHAMFVRKYIYSLPHDSIHSEGMINAKATIGFFGPDVLELQLQRRY